MAKAKLAKDLLGLSAEYAVAGMLCRRGIYAQLTLGKHKRADILAETEKGFARIQVKAKQQREWPGLKGSLISMADFVVFVDFQKKAIHEEPDFYILDHEAWLTCIKKMTKDEQQRFPDLSILDDRTIVYPDGWKGFNIRADRVLEWKDRWDLITNPIKGVLSCK